jgi:hypothetical protein
MRAGSCAVSIVATVLLGILFDGPRFAAQGPESSGPRTPHEDAGACPFEGCVYRDWIANDTIAVRQQRRPGAAVAFHLTKGERAQAITGVVVTLTPGRVQFRSPVTLSSASGSIRIVPGQTLYLLTYRGEGFALAWFEGRLYDDVDGSIAFFNAGCTNGPDPCAGTIIERPRTVWWVQIRNAKGQIGWTDQPEKFGNKDAVG